MGSVSRKTFNEPNQDICRGPSHITRVQRQRRNCQIPENEENLFLAQKLTVFSCTVMYTVDCKKKKAFLNILFYFLAL